MVCLMQKFLDTEDTPNRLLIKSAVCCDNLKGFIYVEADKESHAKQALNGMRNVFTWGMKLVPIKEMTAVLAVPKKVTGLQKDGWVRVKRGSYKGDIGQVVETDETRGRVVVKLIPRLDLAKLTKGEEDDLSSGAKR